MLLDAKTRYSAMERMVLALVTAKKKLRYYFESHTIVVMTDCPIGQILSNPDLSGRLTKWAIELGVYDIKYVSRSARKGQVLADFLVEIQSFDPLEKKTMELPEEKVRWILNTDGASNKNGVGIGIILENSSGVIIEESLKVEEKMTNNEAEYEALLYGMELALRLGARYIQINLDSELVVGQLTGTFEAKDLRMKVCRDTAMSILKEFKSTKIRAVKRELNSHADTLAKATVNKGYSKRTELTMKQDLTKDEMDRFCEINMINTFEGPEIEDDWRKEIVDYLIDSILPKDKRKAQ